jgi:hypothetical protein
MPISANWLDNSETIRLWVFIGDWNWGAFNTMLYSHVSRIFPRES